MTNRLALPFLFFGAVLLAGCGGSNAAELLFSGYGGVCWLIHAVLVIVAFVKIANSSADTGSKLLWAALVFFFPLGGLIAWWVWGPKA